MTPHPLTEMWRDLDTNYGIFEKGWSKFDTKHLVWNHPHCAPGVLEALLEQGFRGCYTKEWLLRTTKKFIARRRVQKDFSSVLIGPARSRWAYAQRLPFLPPRAAPQEQRVRSAVA